MYSNAETEGVTLLTEEGTPKSRPGGACLGKAFPGPSTEQSHRVLSDLRAVPQIRGYIYIYIERERERERVFTNNNDNNNTNHNYVITYACIHDIQSLMSQ